MVICSVGGAAGSVSRSEPVSIVGEEARGRANRDEESSAERKVAGCSVLAPPTPAAQCPGRREAERASTHIVHPFASADPLSKRLRGSRIVARRRELIERLGESACFRVHTTRHGDRQHLPRAPGGLRALCDEGGVQIEHRAVRHQHPISILELRAKGIGVFWKHSSVSSDPRGQRRNCQLPPWFARTLHRVSTTSPAFHTAPDGCFGSVEPSCRTVRSSC